MATEHRVLDRTEVPAVGELGILVQVGEVVDGRRVDARLLELPGDGGGRLAARPLLEPALDLVDAGETAGGGGERRVAPPRRLAEHAHETAPVLVVVPGDRDPAVARAVVGAAEDD